MHFREISQVTRRSGFVERWLRRIFIEDWSLKLLAVAITLILWFVVSGHDVERELAVEPRLEGKPAPSFEVKSVVTAPSHVRVQGPAGIINAIQKAETETISIDGRRESFDVSHTRVYTSDPKVEVLDSVNVHIEIGIAGTQKSKS